MRGLVRLSACGVAVTLLAAGCASDTAPPTATTLISPGTSVAQIAVGSANIFGGTAAAVTGMNVTSTLRTTQGKSVLVSTPFITGPMKLPTTTGIPDGTGSTIESGPTAAEVASESITATNQVTPGAGSGSITATTFGVSGGDFANGFLPQNADNVGNVAFNPYVQPVYDPANLSTGSPPCQPYCDPNGFAPWGGPPAFDPNHDGQGTRDGTFGPGLLGVTEGINIFEGVTPSTGTYNLRIVIPTTTQQYQITARYTMAAVNTLGDAVAPAYVPDGNGGGTFDVKMPSHATDALLNIEDVGNGGANCNSAPAVYTIHIVGSGVYKLPDSDGPGNPSHRHPTICTAAQNAASSGSSKATADSIAVWLIGADYPLYASQYLFTLTQQTPNIFGGAGANDITVSAAGNGGSSSGSIRLHRPLGRF